MKKLLVVHLLNLLLLPVGLRAQDYAIDRGSIVLSGTASFTGSSTRNGHSDSSQLTVAPAVEYFVRPGLALGGAAQLARSKWGEGPAISTIGLGPSVTYYFKREESKVYPFVSGTAGFTWDHQQAAFGSGAYDQTAFTAQVSGGAVFMLSRTIGLNGSAYVGATKYDEGSSSRFGLALGLTGFVF